MSNLQLKKPITAYGKEVTELVLNELTAGQIRKTPKGLSEEEKNLYALACSANIPESSVDEMVMSDVNKALAIIMSFTQSGATN